MKDYVYAGIKSRLSGLKTKIDNLDVHKLKTLPPDISKLSNAVDNDAVKSYV